MKIYAYQEDPEFQEPFLFRTKDFDVTFQDSYPDFILTGNKQLYAHTTEAYDLYDNVEDAIEQYGKLNDSPDRCWYNTLEDLVSDLFRIPKPIDNLNKWKEFLEDEDDNEQRLRLVFLTLKTGKDYDYCMIRGCCQSDWQWCYYPIEDKERVHYLEIEYFNTGTEWVVSTNEEGENDKYSIYVYDDPREEIAKSAECRPEDVILYEFDGYTYTPNYREAIIMHKEA